MTQHGRRIRFLVDWDWKPSPMATIAYRAGQSYYVTLPCADRALGMGKAEPVKGAGAPPAGIRATIARKRRAKAKSDA